MDEINEVGVELSERQLNELFGLMMKVHNTTHLYSNKGWAPEDLIRQKPEGMPVIGFGTGIRQAIEDGTMDREELVRKLTKMGLAVENL